MLVERMSTESKANSSLLEGATRKYQVKIENSKREMWREMQ